MLDRADVDTDQIIPKQFLKRVERTGFGEFLFYDWAKEPGWDLPANPILATGPNFGCGSSREHAPWALAGLRLPGDRRAELRRHLLLQLHQDRPAAGRLPETDVRALMAAGEAEVDLEAQEVRFAGRAVGFEIDAERGAGCSRASTTSRSRSSRTTDRRLRARARARRPGDDGLRMTHDRLPARRRDRARDHRPRCGS